MSGFKNYFSHRLKSTAFRTLVITAVATAFACAVIGTEVASQANAMIGGEEHVGVSSSAEVLVWITVTLAVLFPILETYMLKSSKELDVILSLPVKRSSVAWAHYLSGLTGLIFTTASVFLFAGLLMLAVQRNFYVSALIPMYVWLLLYSVIIYSIVIFLFSRGNTVGDGLVFTFFFIIALFFMAGMIDDMIKSNEFLYRDYVHSLGIDGLPNYMLRDYFSFTGLISDTADYYVELLEQRPVYSYFDARLNLPDTPYYDPVLANTPVSCFDLKTALGQIFYDARVYTKLDHTLSIPTLIIWALSGAASAAAFILSFIGYRAERAGDISDSFFGYRFIIPAAGLSAIVMNNDDILTKTVIATAMLIGYFIYRRSFRIKAEDIFTVVLGIILMMPV